MPAYLDEVTVLQQPRGSYTLEVFRGFLAVGDKFWFTSRRVDGCSFSLTIFVNRQCHVRLSACCESKRKVGTRLGQGVFQLMRVEQADPCVRWITYILSFSFLCQYCQAFSQNKNIFVGAYWSRIPLHRDTWRK